MVAETVWGLDIGMASVGAAVLEGEHIKALHVRTFDKAEQPKTGESLNKARRDARLTRRRLRRRAFRLLRLRRLFKRCGLLPDSQLPQTTASPWVLRVAALDRLLNGSELAQALYHLIKHRGFQSNRKSEAGADEKVGQMLGGVQHNQQLLQQGHYRSVAELVQQHADFQQARRNKAGGYQHTFARADLQQELRLILQRQRELGNPLASTELQLGCETLLLQRRPALSGNALLRLVGKCTFEPDEYRAPKYSPSVEEFVWLGKLNNLYLVADGKRRPLHEDEREIALRLPFELETRGGLKYKQLRKKLGLDSDVRFAGLSYRADGKDPEDAVLFEAKGFHTLRLAYASAGAHEAWQHDRLEPRRLDRIAYALTCFKEDGEIRAELEKWQFADALIETLLEHSFSDFIRLSWKALDKILPFMRIGLRYDQAVPQAGYGHHSVLPGAGMQQRFLPKLSHDDFPNPVVYRALNQARKLVNAMLREYGPPQRIHIELARDMARPFDERMKIRKEQDKFQAEKEKATQLFIDLQGHEPRGQDLLKMRFYREQNAQCPYCQQGLEIARLYDDTGYADIDHILPYSRSFDDSLNNRILVHVACNRNKGNRTPFEFLDGAQDSQRWRNFRAWVDASKLRQAKKQNEQLHQQRRARMQPSSRRAI